MFTALRLILDTGMNALGWTLDEAREFAERHSRRQGGKWTPSCYDTRPESRARHWLTGSDTFGELRGKAEDALGEAFDIRDFHDVVLAHVTVPLAVLQSRSKTTSQLRTTTDLGTLLSHH